MNYSTDTAIQDLNISDKYLTEDHKFNLNNDGYCLIKISSEEWKKRGIDLDEISEVVDIFIETKNVSKLIDTMSKYFSLNYDSESRKNTNEHLIIFNDNAEQLLNNNKLDSFLLKTFGNNKNYENELKNFFSL